ncbi:MAG: DUF2332 domain-containing protein [Microthrixaceae bacterium]|nr:DUF2332 domain-containing protein [Microthrixaceae bacterium]
MSSQVELREEWALRLAQQGEACGELGSDLYRRLLGLLAEEVRVGATTWDVLASAGDLRFGQAGPLRLLGAAHRLALSGQDQQWAALLPSCGGRVPADDGVLLVQWRALVERRHADLVEGMGREVQTNEVGRAAGLALAAAEARLGEARLIEIGSSGGLNLRLDRFEIDLAGVVLGHPESPVHIRPEMRAELGGLRHSGLALPTVTGRVGIDPFPVDPSSEDGRLTLRSYLWPDQVERFERVSAAIEVARQVPAELLTTSEDADTAEVLESVLDRGGSSIVMHSIVWQYIPTEMRWRITEAMERAGSRSTTTAPLVWIRYEPDEWDRRRAAVWMRQWPYGGDRLVAHVDFHGRWLEPV